MLSDPKSSPPGTPLCFFNTSTHKSFLFDLAPFCNDYTLICAVDCLFLLKDKTTQNLAPLNPFTKCITQLPPWTKSKGGTAVFPLEELPFDLAGVYITSSGMIVLGSTIMLYMVWIKPGGENWEFAVFDVFNYSNALFHKDRLYAINPIRGIVRINLADEIPSQPQIQILVPGQFRICHLINCNGQIIVIVAPIYDVDQIPGLLEIYELDVDEERIRRIDSIGENAVFISRYRCFSISCKNSRSIPANCIYFCEMYGDRTVRYNLSNLKLKFWSSKPSLVKQLVRYCLQSN